MESMLSRILNALRLRRYRPPLEFEPKTLCFGRKRLIDDVLRSTLTHGCTLLFGGRQSGKTTTLRNIAEQLPQSHEGDEITLICVPVFVDLMRLNYDASPGDFFATLAHLSFNACAKGSPAPQDRLDMQVGLPDWSRLREQLVQPDCVSRGSIYVLSICSMRVNA